MAARGNRRAAALTAATMLLRYGPPTVGLFLIGKAVIASIGGYIRHWEFALGVVLILAGFTSKLVPKR